MYSPRIILRTHTYQEPLAVKEAAPLPQTWMCQCVCLMEAEEHWDSACSKTDRESLKQRLQDKGWYGPRFRKMDKKSSLSHVGQESFFKLLCLKGICLHSGGR